MSDSDEAEEQLIEETVIFHPFDIIDLPNFKDRGYPEIHFWGLTPGPISKSVLVRIKNYLCHFFVRLPDVIDNEEVYWEEDDDKIDLIINWLNKCLKNDKPVKFEYTIQKDLYHYKKKGFPMLKLYFENEKAMNHCQNLMRKEYKITGLGSPSFIFYNSDITNIRKLHTEKNFKYCQWISLKCKKINTDHSERYSKDGGYHPITGTLTENFEFFGETDTIKMLSEAETMNFTSNPRIIAFDYETYSDNHRAMPKEFNPKHTIFICSVIYERLGIVNSREKYVIVLGNIDGYEFEKDTHIISVKTELELCNEQFRLINTLDPDIITGYNIFAYDYPYLNARIRIKFKEFQPCTRVINEKPYIFSDSWASSAYGTQNINILMMSGRISIDMLTVIRRDYKLSKYDLNTVGNYFLGKGKHDVKAKDMFIAYEQLTKYQKKFDNYQKDIDNIRNGKYDEVKTKLFNEELEIYFEIEKLYRKKIAKFEKLTGLSIDELNESYISTHPNDKLIKKILDLSKYMDEEINRLESLEIPEYLEIKYKNAQEKMVKIVKYCIQDSELVLDLFAKLNIWISLIKFAGTNGVTISQLFTKGQQIRCYSQLIDECYKNNIVINKRKFAKHHFKGAYVVKPLIGLKLNIGTLDFNSLYPSIIIAYNLCFTTNVKIEDINKFDPEDLHIFEWSQEEPLVPKNKDDESDSDEETKPEQTVIKQYKFAFVKKHVQEGILPKFIKRMIKERKDIKNEVKEIKELLELASKISDFEEFKEKSSKKSAFCNTYISQFSNFSDFTNVSKLQCIVKTQLETSLKVSTNSVYGFLGAQTKGILPLIEAAMVVTHMGKVLINQVFDYAKATRNAKVVYGDTDSAMLDLNIVDRKDCYPEFLKLQDEINGIPDKQIIDENGNVQIIPGKKGLFLDPLKIELEKCGDMFNIAPKKYGIRLFGKNGEYIKDNDGQDKIMEKGVLTARRDNHQRIRNVYRKIFRSILSKGAFLDNYKLIINEIVSLLRNEIKAEELTIITGIGSDYKKENIATNIFASELSRMGNPVQAGDRVGYVVVRTKDELKAFKEGMSKSQLDKNFKKGSKMRLLEMWIDSENYHNASEEDKKYMYEPEDLDYLWYIDHSYTNPIDQLFTAAYGEFLDKYSSICYQPKFCRSFPISITKPVAMIGLLVYDQLRGLVNSELTELEKYKLISDQVENLADDFVRQSEIINLKAREFYEITDEIRNYDIIINNDGQFIYMDGELTDINEFNSYLSKKKFDFWSETKNTYLKNRYLINEDMRTQLLKNLPMSKPYKTYFTIKKTKQNVLVISKTYKDAQKLIENSQYIYWNFSEIKIEKKNKIEGFHIIVEI